ncbi:hypothetical protein Tco_1140331, partial [Tanacetum coccineum]
RQQDGQKASRGHFRSKHHIKKAKEAVQKETDAILDCLKNAKDKIIGIGEYGQLRWEQTPPPPTIGSGGKLLCNSVSKLNRSSHMDACTVNSKQRMADALAEMTKRKVRVSGGGGEKKGMADALAEMTKCHPTFSKSNPVTDWICRFTPNNGFR